MKPTSRNSHLLCGLLGGTLLCCGVGCEPASTPPSVPPAEHSPATQTTADPDSTHVSDEEVQAKIEEAARTTAAYAEQTRDEYRTHLEQRLAELDLKLAKMEVESQRLGSAAREKWVESQAQIAAKREALVKQLNDLKDATADSWEHLQQGTNEAWRDLQQAFDAAAQEFKPVVTPEP